MRTVGSKHMREATRARRAALVLEAPANDLLMKTRFLQCSQSEEAPPLGSTPPPSGQEPSTAGLSGVRIIGLGQLELPNLPSQAIATHPQSFPFTVRQIVAEVASENDFAACIKYCPLLPSIGTPSQLRGAIVILQVVAETTLEEDLAIASVFDTPLLTSLLVVAQHQAALVVLQLCTELAREENRLTKIRHGHALALGRRTPLIVRRTPAKGFQGAVGLLAHEMFFASLDRICIHPAMSPTIRHR